MPKMPSRPRLPAHAFRRGFIAAMYERGTPEPVIRRMVGHAGTVTSDVCGATGLWDAMVKADATVPAVGETKGTAVPMRPSQGTGTAPEP